MMVISNINMKTKVPNGFVQNTSSWCWATCAKIVGFDYLYRNLNVNNFLDLIKKYEGIGDIYLKYGIPVDINNLRIDYTGFFNGNSTVDVWQLSIVANVFQNKEIENHLATDDDKERALKYVITGSIYGNISVKTIGQYYSYDNLLSRVDINIKSLIKEKKYFIGNYVLKNTGVAHSVVVIFYDETRVLIYDVWDGYKQIITLEECFATGFLTNKGYGYIQWIQYID